MSDFQWVFDKAETISINKRPMVAQSITRSNVVRAVSYGGGLWRFTVKLPDGMAWNTNRSYIEKIETLDRHTTGTVQITTSGYSSWLTPYLGGSANYTGFIASWTLGAASITLTTSPTTTSPAKKFLAGDVIQLGSSGHVYTVTADVAYNSNTVYLNRAVADATATTTAISVGPNVTWTVICSEFPSWTIFARNQVSWSGPFVFYEVI